MHEEKFGYNEMIPEAVQQMLVGHNDLATILNPRLNPLPVVGRSTIENIVGAAQGDPATGLRPLHRHRTRL